MKYGIGSGALWGLDTVVLSIALVMVPFLGSTEGALTSALLHDVSAALILWSTWEFAADSKTPSPP